MKSLRNYILESSANANVESKTFTFDFTGLENAEDTVKSLENEECITVDGQKVNLKISKEDSYDTALDIIQQYIQSQRNSSKAKSSEEYGQKTKKLETLLGEVFDFIDILENPEEEKAEEKAEDIKDEEKEKEDEK